MLSPRVGVLQAFAYGRGSTFEAQQGESWVATHQFKLLYTSYNHPQAALPGRHAGAAVLGQWKTTVVWLYKHFCRPTTEIGLQHSAATGRGSYIIV